ncbi:peptide chain release factor N(5)-glutamine methyltransferase [Virgibacillus sp. NKC19-3]|uniref:peptide chain release factor N(5)-glutamine methyltransferase n=1 Tax=Virgibacillus saliphilus TaxID=2831674 RepID=UPI001C9AF71D|nr:peptide chain release factor N(5)-glutamine methyltransferase [Virgibacillus sp. NKC19-3]MBY7144741.1 peptide chain release factor N(5)-glutamine methyltransferase [Virgibacillus sp. NKC19-3]
MNLKQYEVLNRASLFLEKHNREPKVAELLLQHHLQVSRSKFYAMMQDRPSRTVVENFQTDISKHALTGVPVQHLTGQESFYGRLFSINEHVLIPRPETEELVQHVIHRARQNKEVQPVIVDVGTGSGVIAITLALEIPNAIVYATDISEEALTIADQNAKRLGAEVPFLQGNFLQPFIDNHVQANIIVSNPPYIAKADAGYLSDTVKNFDPEIALFAAENGLAAYKQIIEQSREVIGKGGHLAFEIGYEQSVAVTALIKNVFPMAEVQTIQDINKKDRIVTVRNR